MDLAAARQRGAQLDPGNDLYTVAFTGGTCLADPGDRVVISERQDAHATRNGLLDQHGWRKEAVRVGAMRMEIDFGVEEPSRSARLLEFTTPRLHLLPWLHDEPDGGAVLVLDDDIDEGRQTDRFDPGLPQVVARDGDRLDRLVGGAGADRLHLGPAVLPNDARDAPATALGRDRAETFRTSPLRCSTSAAPSVAATAPLTDAPLA